MTRRMFALLDADGSAIEYASPAPGRDGEIYTRRLESDPAYAEVDEVTRKPLRPPAKRALSVVPEARS